MKKYKEMMKQIQRVQQDVAKIEEELAKERVESSAGGGAVTAVVNGKQEVLEIKIDEKVVQAGDVEMLQDLVLAAVSEALRKSRELANQRLGRLTGGLNIPGLM